MDSITQLGAAVGEAALGRQVGGKAALWGAALGTFPDLDILAYPLLSPAGELAFHRGPTHALLFSFVTAPLFGGLLARIHKKHHVDWGRWTWLAFLALFTHPLLDAFTAYGTQLFLPFSNVPVAWNTISIIDPLYTVPLLIGVVWAQLVVPAHSGGWTFEAIEPEFESRARLLGDLWRRMRGDETVIEWPDVHVKQGPLEENARSAVGASRSVPDG